MLNGVYSVCTFRYPVLPATVARSENFSSKICFLWSFAIVQSTNRIRLIMVMTCRREMICSWSRVITELHDGGIGHIQ